jgi:hypothetical protein
MLILEIERYLEQKRLSSMQNLRIPCHTCFFELQILDTKRHVYCLPVIDSAANSFIATRLADLVIPFASLMRDATGVAENNVLLTTKKVGKACHPHSSPRVWAW